MTGFSRSRLGAIAIALATAAAAAAKAPPSPKLFAYDHGRPLVFVDRGRVNHKYPIAVDDVSYTSGPDRIPAYLARPVHHRGRLPAVVYLHGAAGDRRDLLVPSIWMAARGAITLAITAPSTVEAEPKNLHGIAFLRWQVRTQARDVVAVRRAVDLLARRKDVDPSRIGFVGWSAGAHTGGLLAGLERRLHAIVLMSGGVAPVEVYASLAPKSQRAVIRRYLGSIDPLRFLPRAVGSRLLLQDGRQDIVVPRAALRTFARATPKGTKIRWYAAGHGLNAAAYRDQLAFLTAKLRATDRVAGAATGP